MLSTNIYVIRFRSIKLRVVASHHPKINGLKQESGDFPSDSACMSSAICSARHSALPPKMTAVDVHITTKTRVLFSKINCSIEYIHPTSWSRFSDLIRWRR